MGLPTADQLADAALSIVIFGPGYGESIVLRIATDEGPLWAVVDSARRQRLRESVNPALDLLHAQAGRPSLVLLTHPHTDHTKGMADLIGQASVGATIGCVEPLLLPPSPYAASEDPDDAAAVAKSQTLLAHQAIQTSWHSGSTKWALQLGSSHEIGGWSLAVLHPDQDTIGGAIQRYAAGGHVNLNDLSAALLVERDDVALVLGADGEEAAWTAVAERLHPGHLRHTRPVKVPHHGSKNGIHHVWIDQANVDPGRPQVVTPFSNSGGLPNFDADQGIERLVASAGQIDLTAMPVDLVSIGGSVSLSAARRAMSAEIFEGDRELEIRLDRPASAAELRAVARDPHKAWVMLGVHLDGRVDVTRGAHAVRVTG